MLPDGDRKSVEDFIQLENKDVVNDIWKVPTGVQPLKCHVNKMLPKLRAPLDMENQDKFWNAQVARKQVKEYFTYLKWKRSKGRPVWWPSSLSFDKFYHLPHNTIRQNKLILWAIFQHSNLNPSTHCEFPEMQEKKKKKQKTKPKKTKSLSTK